MGDIMGDLNQRRGRVQGMDSAGAGDQLIRAQVPMAEMLTYAPTLKSITGGRGEFRMELDHYADVPANIRQQLIEAAEKARQEAQES
jgi:elongation factor G